MNNKVRLVILIQLLSITLSIIFAIFQLYRNVDLVSLISFRLNDPPALPVDGISSPIVGSHYFGDFQSYTQASVQTNSYQISPNGVYGVMYAPLAKIVLSFFTIFSFKIGYVIYFMINLILLFFSNYKVIKHHMNKSEKFVVGDFVIIMLVTNVLTLPFFVDMDRGNFYTISISCLILGYVYSQKNNLILTFFWLSLGTMIQPYFIIIILLLFTWSKCIFWIKIVLGIFVLNLLSLTVFIGDLVSNIKMFIDNNLRYADNFALDMIMNSGSIAGNISRLIELFNNKIVAEIYVADSITLINVLSFSYLIMSWFVWRNSKLPIYLRVFIITSFISVAQPSSAAYSWGWVGIAFALYAFTEQHKLTTIKFVEVIYVLISVLALNPIFLDKIFEIQLRQNPQYLFISSLILILIIKLVFDGLSREKINPKIIIKKSIRKKINNV
jgi:hypothetical protein